MLSYALLKGGDKMSIITKTVKIQFFPTEEQAQLLQSTMEQYRQACNYVSQYIFDNDFECNAIRIQNCLYHTIREHFGLKSQMTDAVFRTVTARYKTERTKYARTPYRYKDENDTWQTVPRTIEWMQKPIDFKQPQADYTRIRDYSFVENRTLLSLNTLGPRIRVPFVIPRCFEHFFDSSWKLGVGKVLRIRNKWYIHIAVSQEVSNAGLFAHVVGIDRGLRFPVVTYDGTHTFFYKGKELKAKREKFARVRAELQRKGTKSAKKVLKRLSGKENRWMSNVNHWISKTLVQVYGPDTLFVLEDLTGISFSEKNLDNRSKQGKYELRSWSFYQLEQYLIYKATENKSEVVFVNPWGTSQRCPHCGIVLKSNRNYEQHKYHCSVCGYESNDDRIGAMNIFQLGIRKMNGEKSPRINR